MTENGSNKNKEVRHYLGLAIFCLAVGSIASLWGYNEASGNLEEQLPLIMRAIDPSYLANDFFTNTFSDYGPRLIYSKFIACLAGMMPLSLVLFVLTFLSNSVLAFLSALTARHFFSNSNFGTYLAAASVLTLKTFWLGYSNSIYRLFLEPAHLAAPLLLLGFYLILKRRFVVSALSFGVAALFHPLMGLECGWLFLGASGLMFFVRWVRKEGGIRTGLPLLIGFGILTVFSVALYAPYAAQSSISDDFFVQLVAYVRHPHHYLPSTFGALQYAQAALYLLVFGVIFWRALGQSEELKTWKHYLLLIGGVIFLLCVGGYLFVEVWPSRLWTTAQTFRLPWLIKWFSLVLMAAWVGNCIEHPIQGQSRLLSILLGIGLVTPASLPVVAFISWLRERRLSEAKIWIKRWVERILFLAMIGLIVLYQPDFRTWALYILLLLLIWLMFLFNWKRSGFILSTGILVLMSLLFLFLGLLNNHPDPLKHIVPVFSHVDETSEMASVAEFVKTNTPEQATFLTPPNYGEFRYLADRAIVVDFTAFSFQDRAMQEWYTRIVNCYGTPLLYGFENIAEFNRVYRDKSDEELLGLAQKYQADYLILFNSDKTDLPIIFSTPSYKLIQVPN